MSPITGQTPLDQAIAALAASQHGVIADWQLRELGLTADAIVKRVRAGRLHRLYRGVFAVGHRVLRPEGHLMAAALACEGVISHVDAAELHGIRRRGYVRSRIHVTSPTRAGRRYKRLRVHDGSGLTEADVTRVENIPTTSVSRTILDLADTGPVIREVERAEALGIFDLVAMNELLARSNGRRGTGRVRDAITRWQPTWTRSDMEDQVLTICDSIDVPRPEVNVWFPDLQIEVDFLWRVLRLIIEADSQEHHASPSARERDYRRDSRLRRRGWRVERFTWREIFEEPERVRELLIEASSAR
jgi:hypothetical protein